MVRSKAFERKREKCKIPGIIRLFFMPGEIDYICENLKMDK